MKILILNGGSSTLKAKLYELEGAPPGPPPAPLWEAHAEWGRREGKARLRIRSACRSAAESEIAIGAPHDVFRPLLEALWSGPVMAVSGPGDIAAVGHRVVHGGHAYQQPARLTPDVREGILRCAEFAPEHNRLELEIIEAAERALGPGVPQVAAFDTAFHSELPLAAKVYPIPLQLYENGIARYGFHGISHQYASRRAAEILGRDPDGLRLITCHLGNGASLAAVRGGRSVDTTMGFTPLEGLMMGRRCGSIDPGILIYLVRDLGYGADELDHALNEESGLKGVSGISGDMRDIVSAMQQGNQRAKLAYDVYLHRLVREIGAMAASLGGLDVLVFTAGVGENCVPLRADACSRLEFLGVRLDAARNASPGMDCDIAADDSPARILVVRAEEDWEIARECWRLLRG